jgi:hypothetical protein
MDMANDDPQDQAEALDDDELGGDYPPEEPLGVEEYGTTPAEERYDEPLDERVLREEPEGARPDGAADPSAGDPTLHDVVTEREAPVPAEEAALHVTDGD